MRTVWRGVRLSEPDISSDWGSLAKIRTLSKSISCARVESDKQKRQAF